PQARPGAAASPSPSLAGSRVLNSPSQNRAGSVMSDYGRASTPLPQEPALQSVAGRLTKALVAYYSKQANKSAAGPSWTRFFAEARREHQPNKVGDDGSGLLTFAELETA
ncbi:unnamed protein product, partial [Polarella glacialis]